MKDVEIILAKVYKGCILYHNHTLGRWINEETYIVKKSVQCKDLSHKWLDEVNPEDIDLEHYYSDGIPKKWNYTTRKHENYTKEELDARDKFCIEMSRTIPKVYNLVINK